MAWSSRLLASRMPQCPVFLKWMRYSWCELIELHSALLQYKVFWNDFKHVKLDILRGIVCLCRLLPSIWCALWHWLDDVSVVFSLRKSLLSIFLVWTDYRISGCDAVSAIGTTVTDMNTWWGSTMVPSWKHPQYEYGIVNLCLAGCTNNQCKGTDQQSLSMVMQLL